MKAVPHLGDGVQHVAASIAQGFHHLVLVFGLDLVEIVPAVFPGESLRTAEAKEVALADPLVVMNQTVIGRPAAVDPRVHARQVLERRSRRKVMAVAASCPCDQVYRAQWAVHFTGQ